MKRLFSLILIILILTSTVACGNTNDTSLDGESSSDNTESAEPEATESESEQPNANTYDGVFQTGFSRVAITPSVPIGDFTKVENDIYATCMAVYDGARRLMFVSVDMEYISEGACNDIKEQITQATSVPWNNIFISATHNHSGPSFGWNYDWSVSSYDKIADAAMYAVADLSDTELFIGTGKTTGMAFVRRYVDAYGNYASVTPSRADGASLDSSTIRSVSEADDTLQVIRFVRKEKKDIVAMNWQAHLAHALDAKPAYISSDMAHYIRNDIESGDDDALVIYFAGASGNINLNAPHYSQKKYRNYVAVAQALAKVTLEVIKDENLTRVEAGKISIKNNTYREAYRNIPISAISFGDLAFVTAPYEMFDNNGMQIKEGSPFKMTFVLTNSGGALGYIPSFEACTQYGGYEVDASSFGVGVAENLVAEYLRMLKAIKR